MHAVILPFRRLILSGVHIFLCLLEMAAVVRPGDEKLFI